MPKQTPISVLALIISEHAPEDFQFHFTRSSFAGFDCILQGHSQGAPATDVQDLVTGLDASLLTGWGAWHHLQTVDTLPFTANAACQLDSYGRNAQAAKYHNRLTEVCGHTLARVSPSCPDGVLCRTISGRLSQGAGATRFVTALPSVMLSRLGDDLRIVMATSSATLVTSCPFT